MSNKPDLWETAEQAKEIPAKVVGFRDKYPPLDVFVWLKKWRQTPPPTRHSTDSIEAGLYEALGEELEECPHCKRMLDISMHHRHQVYGCTLADQAFK